MQHVLASYSSRSAAEMAVRALESQGYSIQNVVIADAQQRAWRKLHTQERPMRAQFVVYTLDDAASSEWARSLLGDAKRGIAAG